MNQLEFDIKQTNIIKGFLIILLLLHHVFGYQVTQWFTLFKDGPVSDVFMKLALYGKVCIGGFCFLSAYGITKKMMQNKKTMQELVISRIVKIYMLFWPIYILGIAGGLLFGNSPVWQNYISPRTQEFSWLLMLIDILGLTEFFKTNDIVSSINVSWWYVSAALMIVVLMPIFYKLYCKFREWFVIVIAVSVFVFGTTQMSVLWITMAAGICFAREDLFVKIKAKMNGRIRNRIIGYILILMFLYLTFELSIITDNIVATPFGTIACVLFCYMILSDIPILNWILAFIGKYSANIFYVHTFLFLYWFPYTIYSIGNKFLVYCTVLIGSLLVSIIIELFKKLTHYYDLEKKIIQILTNQCKRRNIDKCCSNSGEDRL